MDRPLEELAASNQFQQGKHDSSRFGPALSVPLHFAQKKGSGLSS